MRSLISTVEFGMEVPWSWNVERATHLVRRNWGPSRNGYTNNIAVAASMQCLRLSSFFSRPRLLTVETLVMMGPYLINSGRFLDAWTLFGLTVRLAQSIGRESNLCANY